MTRRRAAATAGAVVGILLLVVPLPEVVAVAPTLSPALASLDDLWTEAEQLGITGAQKDALFTRADLLGWIIAARTAPTRSPVVTPSPPDGTDRRLIGVIIGLCLLGLCVCWHLAQCALQSASQAEDEEDEETEMQVFPGGADLGSAPFGTSGQFNSTGSPRRRVSLGAQALLRHLRTATKDVHNRRDVRRPRCCQCCTELWERFLISVRRSVSPFDAFLNNVQSSYGAAVLPYFTVTAWAAFINLAVYMLWIFFAMIPWAKTGTTSWREVGLNLVGVADDRLTDGSFWFYSGYTEKIGDSDEPYEMGIAYVLLLFTTFGMAYASIIMEIADRIRSVPQQVSAVSTKLQMAVLAYGWDWKIWNPSATDTMMRGVWLKLRAIHELEECEKEPVHWPKRLGAVLLSFMITGGAVCGLYFLLVNKDALDEDFPFVSSIIVACVNLGVPFLQRRVVPWMQIANPRHRVMAETMAIFISRMVNVLFILNEITQIEDDRGRLLPTLTKPIGGPTPTRVYAESCPQFLVGLYMQQLLLVDFISGACADFIGGWLTVKFIGKQEFQIASHVLATLYRQCLLWLAVVYAPGVLPVGIVGHIASFFVSWAAMFRFCKTPEQPASHQGSSFFFHGLLFATLVVALVPFVLFLMKEMTCGPHAGGVPMTALTDAIGVDEIDKGPLGPAVWIPIAVALATVLYLMFAAFQGSKERHARAVGETTKEIRLLRRRAKNITEVPRPRQGGDQATSVGAGLAASAQSLQTHSPQPLPTKRPEDQYPPQGGPAEYEI